VVITDSRPIVKPTAVTLESGSYDHVDANMSPRYDPCCYSTLLVVLVLHGEVPDLMYFDRIIDDSIILMGDTIVGGAE
jgi:hypothetical protein